MCQLFIHSAATGINYDSLSLWIITSFFTIQGTAGSCYVLNYKQPPHQVENII